MHRPIYRQYEPISDVPTIGDFCSPRSGGAGRWRGAIRHGGVAFGEARWDASVPWSVVDAFLDAHLKGSSRRRAAGH
jgi:hypothetical protein